MWALLNFERRACEAEVGPYSLALPALARSLTNCDLHHS